MFNRSTSTKLGKQKLKDFINSLSNENMENKLDNTKEPQPDLKLPVSGSVLKIKLHEYAYHCGDGCCYNYGTITTINDIELPCHNQDAGTILQQVLEHLGYKVEIDYSDDVE